MPAVEVLRASLLHGSDISDPNSNVAKIIQESAETVLKQDGCSQVYFGLRIEDSSTLQLIVDWESLDKHKAFTISEIYPAFVERLFSVTTGMKDIQLIHVDFRPEDGLKKALNAPLTSIATFYFENGQPPSDYESSAQKFFENVRAGGADGSLGNAFGLSFEDIEFEGVKGRVAVLIAGWSSMEEYERVHALPLFRENVKYVRHGVSRGETHYVHFTKVKPS